MPNTTTSAIDHRILGTIRRAIATVSPRLVRDVTTQSEDVRYRDVVAGTTYVIVVGPHIADGSVAGPELTDVGRQVLAAVWDELAASPFLVRDVRHDGDSVTFVLDAMVGEVGESAGKTFAVSIQDVQDVPAVEKPADASTGRLTGQPGETTHTDEPKGA